MSQRSFVGRRHELGLLHDLLLKKVASLVVIKGRRRIGKSRLIEEFARNQNFLVFSGLPPTASTTNESQLSHSHSYQRCQRVSHGKRLLL